MAKFTDEEQALIDGVELAFDWCLQVSEEDVKEYHRLMARNEEE